MSDFQIIFNHEKMVLDRGTSSLLEILKQQGLSDKKGIAVAVNQSIIRKEEWENTFLKNNDDIMVITATQGG